MAGITLAQAEARLTEYMNAESKVLKGQKVVIDGEELSRADLESIQKGVTYWDAKAKELSLSSSGRSRSRNVSPGF